MSDDGKKRGDDQNKDPRDDREDDRDEDQYEDPDDDRDDDELTWAEKEEKYGRAWVEAELNPYDPDPELERYLSETDTSLDNEDLGRDKDGNRDDE